MEPKGRNPKESKSRKAVKPKNRKAEKRNWRYATGGGAKHEERCYFAHVQ